MQKKNLIFGIIFIAVFLVAVPMNAGANFMDPVSFYLIDNPDNPISGDDNSVELSVLNFNFGQYDLQYSADNTSWTYWTAGTDFDVNTKSLIYFRIINNASTYTGGDLTFQSYQDNYYGVNAYRSLAIDWGNAGRVTFTTPEETDLLGPVPIPATAWLFGAGLFGLVGIRRKFRR